MEKIGRIEELEKELEAMKLKASEWKDLCITNLERNRNLMECVRNLEEQNNNLMEYVRTLEEQNSNLNNMLLYITSTNTIMEYDADEMERLK